MPKHISQKEVWNSVAPLWKDYRTKSPDFVKDFLKNKKGNILDLGCGSGRNFSAIKGKVFAVDFSPEMLKYAKQLAKKLKIKAEFFETEASNLPFKDNFFDSAIYIASLQCIDTEEARQNSLKELFRVLKPGAKALISVWSKNSKALHGRTGKLQIGWAKDNKQIKRYYFIYEREQLKSALRSKGFKIISVKEDSNIMIVVQKPRR